MLPELKVRQEVDKRAPSLDGPSVTDTQQQELLWSANALAEDASETFPFYLFTAKQLCQHIYQHCRPPQKKKKTHRRAKANSSAAAGVRREATNTPRGSQKLNKRTREREHVETQVDTHKTMCVRTERSGQEGTPPDFCLSLYRG